MLLVVCMSLHGVRGALARPHRVQAHRQGARLGLGLILDCRRRVGLGGRRAAAPRAAAPHEAGGREGGGAGQTQVVRLQAVQVRGQLHAGPLLLRARAAPPALPAPRRVHAALAPPSHPPGLH
ncbi:hypothetical protein T492DRAFT_926401 [Pavlovales sp. CCMP2436]|nr:hypothetical protein T492DRAFT_926401 [Pavlovales sp. CCMP2436]